MSDENELGLSRLGRRIADPPIAWLMEAALGRPNLISLADVGRQGSVGAIEWLRLGITNSVPSREIASKYVGCRGDERTMIVCIFHVGNDQLSLLAAAKCLLGLCMSLACCRQQEGRQQRDRGHNHEQLEQRKGNSPRFIPHSVTATADGLGMQIVRRERTIGLR